MIIRPIQPLHRTANNSPKDKSKPIPKINHTDEILELLDGIAWTLDNINKPNDMIKSKLDLIRYHLQNI
jgi:hypothetical protein